MNFCSVSTTFKFLVGALSKVKYITSPSHLDQHSHRGVVSSPDPLVTWGRVYSVNNDIYIQDSSFLTT